MILRSDIGEVIKTIVADEAAYPDYRLPKKTTGRKKQGAKQAHEKNLTTFRLGGGIGRWNQEITAPHTDGMKGGCSPQNNCGNIRRLLNQRPAHENQAFAGFFQ
jgi:hypothetical protein